MPPSKARAGSQNCCRRAETETERAPKILGCKFLSKQAATQWTRVQRLGPENKGKFLIFHLEQAAQMGLWEKPEKITDKRQNVHDAGAR
jgi:hypothetical protein